MHVYICSVCIVNCYAEKQGRIGAVSGITRQLSEVEEIMRGRRNSSGKQDVV